MRVCIVGPGAIGGLLAVKLSLSGNEVAVIGRGKHLQAIQEHGLKLLMDGKEYVASDIRAESDIKVLGEQDVVFLALKAQSLPSFATSLGSLIGKDTTIVTLQNGIPWWYFQKFSGPFGGTVLKSVDPDGSLFHNIDPDRLIGCVVYPAASIAKPGVIEHHEGVRFPVGELDGSTSERVTRLSEMLIKAGFKSPVLPEVRNELWLKLWGSTCFNPVSALTHATLQDICTYPATRQLSIDVMTEVKVVAEKIGVSFRVPLEKRLNGAAAVGDHKTSMLQDVESGRTTELGALVGSVVEIAALTETAVPHLSTIYALSLLLDKKLEHGGLQVQLSKPAAK